MRRRFSISNGIEVLENGKSVSLLKVVAEKRISPLRCSR
jgi:hypothetical protein